MRKRRWRLIFLHLQPQLPPLQPQENRGSSCLHSSLLALVRRVKPRYACACRNRAMRSKRSGGSDRCSRLRLRGRIKSGRSLMDLIRDGKKEGEEILISIGAKRRISKGLLL